MATILHPFASRTPGGGGPLAIFGKGEHDTVRNAGNMRTANMYDEAVSYRATLTECEVRIKNMRDASLEFLESILPVLSAPLPRVWDNVEGGLAEPIRTTVSHATSSHLAGTDASPAGIRQAMSDLEQDLTLRIVKPLAQWREALDTAKERMPEVNRLRNELDKADRRIKHEHDREERRRRRELGLERGAGRNLLYRCTHPRAESPPPPAHRARSTPRARSGHGTATAATAAAADGSSAASTPSRRPAAEEEELGRDFHDELRIEERNMSATYRQRKREAIMRSFEEQEKLLFEQLSGLCCDAAWLKSYLVAALARTKDTLQLATAYLGSTKQPLPGTTGARAGHVRGGETAFNTEVIVAPPKYLQDRTSREATLERMRARAERRGLHAHRATASPMELFAREDLSALSAMPPARRAQADRPLAPLAGEPAGATVM